MTSKIVVNNIEADSGISTISFINEVTAPTFNGNITGTAATFTTGTFSGNVDIAGALTYEDVTNVDSVGIITAQSDISIADKIVHTSDTNTAIRFPAADTFTVETGGAEAIRVDSSGRLLVGTTAAGSNGTADDLVVANNSSASDQAGITIRGGTSGRSQIFFSDGTSGDAEYRGMLRYDHSEESMQFRTAATERLRITSTGLVGVNCTPLSQFQVKTATNANIALTADGSEASIEAFNDAGSASVPLRIRGSEIKFKIDGTQRARIYYSSSSAVLSLGDESNSAGHLRLEAKASENQIHGRSNHPITFLINTAEKLRITSDGNVNIGNKNHLSHHSTVDSLQIGYALNLYEDSYTSGTDNYVVLGNNVHYNSGNKYMRNDEASRIMMQAGTFYFQSAATGTAGNAISFTDVLRITSAGKIGLDGMTNPVAKLHIGTEDDSALTTQTLFVEGAKTGFASYTGLPQNQLCLYDNTASTAGSGGAISFAANCGGSQQTWIAAMESQRDSSTNDASNYAGSLVFWTRPAQSTPTEKIRIKSTGEIKIPGSSGSMLTINESNPSGNFYQEISYAPNSKGCLYLANFAYYSSQPALVINDKDTNNARVMEDVQFQRNGSMKGYIRINPGSVTYSTSSSDIRTKKNFEDWTEDNLSKFKTLSPKLFNWIEEDDGSEKTKGFIAQDNLEKFPEAYPLTASTDRYAFNPSGMVAYLMKALQESALKIETLEGRLDAAGL